MDFLTNEKINFRKRSFYDSACVLLNKKRPAKNKKSETHSGRNK